MGFILEVYFLLEELEVALVVVIELANQVVKLLSGLAKPPATKFLNLFLVVVSNEL